MKNIFKKNNYYKISESERMSLIEKACKQVSRGVFFSTVIIITSFLPVFLLTGQEGKLFHPLAYTKTFIMMVDALLVVTLAPVLISFFMKGKFKDEHSNPVNRIPLIVSLGSEFMPPLDEQSILFMPITLPDISNAEVKRILQVQDKLIH